MNRVTVNNVGKSQRTNTKVFDVNKIQVQVKRQDSTVEQAFLLDEFHRLINTALPDCHNQFLVHPPVFKYDQSKLHQTEGFPEVARDMLTATSPGNRGGVHHRHLTKWTQHGLAETAEDVARQAMVRAFSGSPGLLFNGLKREKLFSVARRALGFGGHTQRGPINQQEKDIYQMVGIDMDKLIQETTSLVEELFPDPAVSSLQEQDLLTNLSPALRVIKPGYAELSGDAQNKYRDKLRNSIQKEYKSAIGNHLTKTEVHSFLVRHLLGTYLDLQDEYDSLLVDRSSSCLFQLEVKSWPQHPGDLGSPGSTPPGLKDKVESANLQLGKGLDLYNHVLGPAAALSPSWTSVRLIVLPFVATRKDLEDRGVEAAKLPFFLTREELDDRQCQWKQDLQLGSNMSSEEEYKRLVAVIYGSYKVSFQSQVYDREAEVREAVEETLARITGPSRPVVGLGGWSGDILNIPRGIGGLRGLELGHVHNVSFWSDPQSHLLEFLKKDENVIVIGHNGFKCSMQSKK